MKSALLLSALGLFSAEAYAAPNSKRVISIVGKSKQSSSAMSSSSPSTSSSPTSSSLSTTDAEILNYALTLEHLEVAFYSQGLTNFSEDAFAQAGFAAAVRANYEEILEHEETHIEFLDAVLTSAGAQTVEACVYDFSGSVDVESFIAMSAALETVGASAYSGASGLFSDSDLVPSAASILSTEARQSTWIQNTVQKLNPWSGAFEVPLSPNQVFTIASNFIVSCPSSNPPIIATAPFPQLTIPATAAPGQQVQLSFSTQSSYSPSDLAVAFLTSNGTVFTEFSGSSYTMTFPTTEQLLGTVFVLIVNSTSESVTDATTVAGPTPLMFPFNATDPAVEALFPDISGNSSASSSGISSGSSSSLSTNDAEILNYALTLEHLEVAFYSQGLANFSADAFTKAGFAAAVRANYEEILGHETTHVETLDGVLTSAGAQTVESCVYDFSGSVDVNSFIAMSAAFETVGASAYSGASGLFTNNNLIPAAASILSTEARQSTWIQNTVQKLNPWSGAFEVPLSPNQIFTIASTFIVSCPSSNPPIIATKAFPPLTIPATAAPGQQVQLSFATESSYSPSDLAVAFLTSNGTLFEEFSGSSYTVTFPTTEQLLGTVFVLIVNSTSAAVTDATTVAGPTPLMFPFNATDPAVEALFPDIS